MDNNAQRCRAIALLCRQQASIHPEQNWKWLAQAERWEHLADAQFVLKAEKPRSTLMPSAPAPDSAAA